ncbi:MAG: AEC family transporter [Granulosicoccaceae bacterium]
MIFNLLVIVAPVFLMIACGYFAAFKGWMSREAIEGLMRFAQGFAIPCLLFNAVMTLDLGGVFEWRLLASFYTGSIACFVMAMFVSRLLFGRRPGESVVVGFGALFSNSVLLGLPITERAFGADALAPNYAIVSLHAPICYLLGVVVMEFSRADGKAISDTLREAFLSLSKNPLMIGIGLGFVANVTGLSLWQPVQAWLDMAARAALPVALFGLGAVLTRYQISKQVKEPMMVIGFSLLVHPTLTWTLCTQVFELPIEFTRSAVVTAAMAPGINAYLFANMYQRAQDVAANAVLLGTAFSVLTASAWLLILGV